MHVRVGGWGGKTGIQPSGQCYGDGLAQREMPTRGAHTQPDHIGHTVLYAHSTLRAPARGILQIYTLLYPPRSILSR